MKMMLNTVSTGTMAKMGRVRGNYMVHLNISNKKQVITILTKKRVFNFINDYGVKK